MNTTVHTEVKPLNRQPGEGLTHTCAEHPTTGSGPHHPGCVAFCGFVSKTGSGDGENVRDADSCVVCDAMFDARFRP